MFSHLHTLQEMIQKQDHEKSRIPKGLKNQLQIDFSGNYFQSRDEGSFARVKFYELTVSHE